MLLYDLLLCGTLISQLYPCMAWEPLRTGHRLPSLWLQLDLEQGGWGRHRPVAWGSDLRDSGVGPLIA